MSVKLVFVSCVLLCCAGCTPFATYPDGQALYPGAYRVEWNRIHAPSHKVTFYEKYIEGTGCSVPIDSEDRCEGEAEHGLLSLGD